jgi:hypothetical protein
MLAALMMGHHFSISAFCCVRRREQRRWPVARACRRSVRRSRQPARSYRAFISTGMSCPPELSPADPLIGENRDYLFAEARVPLNSAMPPALSNWQTGRRQIVPAVPWTGNFAVPSPM